MVMVSLSWNAYKRGFAKYECQFLALLCANVGQYFSIAIRVILVINGRQFLKWKVEESFIAVASFLMKCYVIRTNWFRFFLFGGLQTAADGGENSSNFTLSWSNHLFDLYTSIFSIKSQNRSAYYYLVTPKIMFRICFVWMMFSVWGLPPPSFPPFGQSVPRRSTVKTWACHGTTPVLIVAPYNIDF